ncbi:MAG: hypothetical protein Q9M94_07055 [Candidatus Gracilibacteria bacterium]|nr:hypothetical protein [Candidatus Gracilibacteria bacterium]MDQ7023916.1 hypothetical protein [Candidatus Gracilibacteria bacterium]
MKKINKSVIIFALSLLFTLVLVPIIETRVFNLFIKDYYWNHYWFEYGTIWILTGILPIYYFYQLNIEIERSKKTLLDSNINLEIFFRLLFFMFFLGFILFLSFFLGLSGLRLDELIKFIIVPLPILIIIFFMSKIFINKALLFSNNEISEKLLWGILLFVVSISFLLGNGVIFTIYH